MDLLSPGGRRDGWVCVSGGCCRQAARPERVVGVGVAGVRVVVPMGVVMVMGVAVVGSAAQGERHPIGLAGAGAFPLAQRARFD